MLGILGYSVTRWVLTLPHGGFGEGDGGNTPAVSQEGAPCPYSTRGLVGKVRPSGRGSLACYPTLIGWNVSAKRSVRHSTRWRWWSLTGSKLRCQPTGMSGMVAALKNIDYRLVGLNDMRWPSKSAAMVVSYCASFMISQHQTGCVRCQPCKSCAKYGYSNFTRPSWIKPSAGERLRTCRRPHC